VVKPVRAMNPISAIATNVINPQGEVVAVGMTVADIIWHVASAPESREDAAWSPCAVASERRIVLRRQLEGFTNGELSAGYGPMLQIFDVPPGRDKPASADRDQQATDLLLHLP
jgi:hypothetical protein